MVTPLLPDGSPDLESLDRLTDHLLGAGVVGLLVLGSTGGNSAGLERGTTGGRR